jgi:acetyl esterase/lipase
MGAPYDYDPELVPFLPLIPALDITDVDAARAQLRAVVAQMAPAVDTTGLVVSDHLVGRDGGPAVPVRVWRPEAGEVLRPGLLYVHGGGFVAGSIETEQAPAAELARELGIVVASVEYRLAPEHPYPAALEDCAAALDWLHAAAPELGVDPSRVGVYGQSAGGGLAAALALFVRDHGGPAVCFQFLGMPELDDRLDTPSMRSFVDTPMWNRPSAELSWRYYLGDRPEPVPAYAAPARATDLSGLPPAYVTAMQYDPLRDEAIDYAARLLRAGVPAELHVFPGQFHGSILFPTAMAARARAEALAALRRGLRIER